MEKITKLEKRAKEISIKYITNFGHKSTLAVPACIFPNFGNFGNYSSGNKCLARVCDKAAPD